MKLTPSLGALVALALTPSTATAAQLNVLTRPGTTPHHLPRGARVLERIPALGVTAISVPSADAARITADLKRTSGVASASPVAHFRYRDLPDDPALTQPEPEPGTLPGTTLEWWALKESLPDAWSLSHGNGIRVGVIDSGIDARHVELRHKISSAVDVERFHGRARTDTVGHGTHVASLACAEPDNGVGIAGAGYGCKIVAIKTDLSDLSVAAGMVEAVKRHVQVLNMSFGATGRQKVPAILRRAVAYDAAHDVVMVAAAADSPTTQNGDPANLLQPTGTGPDIARGKGVVVTAATVADVKAGFAGKGTQISLAAYGTYRSNPLTQGGPIGILGAFPENRTTLELGTIADAPCDCRVNYKGDQGYAYLAGTSMAAPEVAGVAALVRSANRRLSAAQVVRILKQSATRPSGAYSTTLGWGIVNGLAAVQLAQATKGSLKADV